jgi:hypothetical protein
VIFTSFFFLAIFYLFKAIAAGSVHSLTY